MTTTTEGIALAVERRLLCSRWSPVACDLATELLAEREAHEATKAKLAASDALAAFAKHDSDCALSIPKAIRSRADIQNECSCGLDKATAASHRPEPAVDVLLIEARKIAASTAWLKDHKNHILSGEGDDSDPVKIALAALKRGMELAKRGHIVAAGGGV